MPTTDFTKDLLLWITSDESPVSILYGGTPEEDKVFRFASLEEVYTVDELIELFKKSPNGSKYAS